MAALGIRVWVSLSFMLISLRWIGVWLLGVLAFLEVGVGHVLEDCDVARYVTDVAPGDHIRADARGGHHASVEAVRARR